MLASGLRPGKEDGMGVSFILLMSSKCMIILAEGGFETNVRYCLDMEIDGLASLCLGFLAAFLTKVCWSVGLI